MTASSGGSAFRPTCRSACRALPAYRNAARGREFEEFPELMSYLMRRFPNPPKSQHGAPEAQAEIKYRDLKPVSDETAGFNRIADELHAVLRAVHDAASPGIISTTMLNAHYESHDAYLDALAREMSNEYRAINKAGLVLADRRARSRHGPHHDIPRSVGLRTSSNARTPRRRHQ